MIKKKSTKTHAVKWGFFSQVQGGVTIMRVATGLIILLVLGLILTPQPNYRDGFRTLEELQQYASTLDEWIKMDGMNIANPSYESYYQKKFSRTFPKKIYQKIQWVLSLLHLKKPPIFSESFFYSELNELVTARGNIDVNEPLIQKIELKESSKVVVFGSIQGAFHSLVRYLEKLKELGIIDLHLKITNPNYYLIFLGDVVNRSPYTLEIFSIVLKLLAKNPNNVIYLRGPHEYPAMWKKQTLGRELELCAPTLLKSKIQLEQEVEAFFNTLPIALYCTVPSLGKKINYFRLSHLIGNEQLRNILQKIVPTKILKQKSQHGILTLPLSQSSDSLETTDENVSMKAIITGIQKRNYYEQTDGLRLLPPINGIIAWTTLSTPAEPYRIGLKFFYDAFVIITPSKNQDWVITLYNRDIRESQNNDFKIKSYNFFSGEQLM